jgi:hypothetical protein
MPIPANGLQLWLKGDAGVTLTGSTVSKWADQSGNNNDAIQMDPRRQPFLAKDGLNGKPVIRFDGADDRLGLTGSKRMSTISVFMVVRIDSGVSPLGAYQPLTFGDAFADGQIWSVDMHSRWTGNSSDTINIIAGWYSAVQAATLRCAEFGRWKILTVVTDGVIRNTSLRANGANATITSYGDSKNMFLSVPVGNATGTGVGGIGGADGIPFPEGSARTVAKCDIAEVIVYEVVLSDSLRRSVEQYLAARYGLPQMAGARK